MRDVARKLRLADRAETILRSDRKAFLQARREQEHTAVLLTLVPDNGAVMDLMDAYIPEIAETAGLQYIRLVSSDLRDLPGPALERTFLLLADLTGRDETVITLVYQALGVGRRVLLTAQDPSELSPDLSGVRSVLYNLQEGELEALFAAVRSFAFSALDEDDLPQVSRR
jgi:hypothetical protein